jgi:hypothetical protein
MRGETRRDAERTSAATANGGQQRRETTTMDDPDNDKHNDGKPGGTGDGKGSGGDLPPHTPPKAERTFSQAEVDRIVNDRLARDRQSRGQASGPDKTEGKKPEGGISSDPTWVFDMQDAIEAAIDEVGGAKLTPGQKRRMRADYAQTRPSDPNAWAKTWLEDLGFKKPEPNNPSQAKKDDDVKLEPKPGDATPIRSDKGPPAPGGARDPDQISLERPLEMTRSDIERLQEKHGEEKANAMIRDRVNAALRKMKLVADPRRKQ